MAVLVDRAAALHRAAGGDLLACFAQVGDPRDPRGVRHSVASILGLCVAAVLAGSVSLTQIGDWIAAAPQEVLERTPRHAGTRAGSATMRELGPGVGLARWFALPQPRHG